MRPGCFDPMLFKPEVIDKANFMISDTMGREDEQMFVTGMVIIVDVQGFSLNHLTQKPLALFKKQMYFLQVLVRWRFISIIVNYNRELFFYWGLERSDKSQNDQLYSNQFRLPFGL